MHDMVEDLLKIGFSEYEAKAYIALLRKNPVTGYELSKQSGVPRSMIYEVANKLTARGAAMAAQVGGSTKFVPVPAEDFLDQLEREQETLFQKLRSDLAGAAETPELEYVWNIEGHDNIMAKAIEMLNEAQSHIYIALVPATFETLQPALEKAIRSGLRVVVYTTAPCELAGAEVVTAPISQEALEQARGLGLILVVDGREVLIGEWLTEAHAWASWTRSPLFVFVTEHHLRTDLYLPQLLNMLGENALRIIHEADRDLFLQAMESHTAG